jgi:hypothetical protein
MLFVFGTGALRDDVPLSPSRFGAPSQEARAMCEVRRIERAAAPAWFDGWRKGSLRAIAEQDLKGQLAALDAADHVHLIDCRPGPVSDLAYLQAAWAHARHLAARGAAVVLDAHAMAFTSAAALPAADAALDVKREVRVIYETDSSRADQAHALHTRGMRKFGAPDLIALCTDADVPLVAHAIGELADKVARGTDLAAKHAIDLAAGVRWVAVEDEHRLGDVLQLNNEARVIVDERGHDLMGVMSRLPRPASA